MCLIIFAHQAESRYPLVLTANRDEFFSRPTQHAKFWESSGDNKTILAGKDLVAGGTWLGLTQNGRFSAVTNIRDPSQPEQKPRSRGELTTCFLQSDASAEDYSNSLSDQIDQFAGFNLLLGDGREMFYINNFEKIVTKLEPGIYGLSNGLLNSDWPKVNRGREDLQQLLETDASISTDQLINMMNQREHSPDASLPDTGVSLELERVLSSTFIMNTDRGYGTLCSTAIIRQADGNSHFSEQNYDIAGRTTDRHYYKFSEKP
jgi:uncharacterized protein with NRDE domain